MPTRTAAAGRFQSRGEDMIQFLDEFGRIVCWTSGDGTHFCKDCITADGVSVSDLQRQVNAIQFSGLPSIIDSGTF